MHNRKIKTIESIWQEVGVPFTQDIMTGYIMAHFEQVYLGLRDKIAINVLIYPPDEAELFINKCCKAFGCRVAFIDNGELWVVKKDNPIQFKEIPSRLSDNLNDHRIRGHLLGYNDEVIESYFLD